MAPEYRRAILRLGAVGERWFAVPRRTEAVAEYLHEFYAAWVS
jgi:hypothetical protein